jgi:hypothetical protein
LRANAGLDRDTSIKRSPSSCSWFRHDVPRFALTLRGQARFGRACPRAVRVAARVPGARPDMTRLRRLGRRA